MELNPQVYILLATYNRAHLIKETLVSIQNQTYTNFACLITDDNSTDDTERVVQSFIKNDKRFKYFKKPSTFPQGLSATRNFGLDLAEKRNAEFIHFFDDDDLIHPQKLELQIDSLIKTESDLCLCSSVSFKDNHCDKIQRRKKVFRSSNLGEDYLLGKIHFGAPIPLFRFEYINKQRFDNELHYAEEWVCFTKLFYRYPPKVTYVDMVLFYQRKHLDSITLGSDPCFNKAKSSAITSIILYNYLTKFDLHTAESYKYFANIFLFQTHNPKLLNRIVTELKQKEINSILVIQINFFKTFLKFQRRIFNKVSTWI
ncbi:glycosyltransferase [Leeuwenhoekiella palythoae]|uniref:glycosyltransferase family 2 protein n=1 Tax=Leeuwenhoekiella palythoae TaxID=573501 RepID=UPI001CE1BD82|nr:glycosyltransferase family 2 protein [Leeuwenhoekiella palythoae]UBZ11213.1 glycosyltransferase [Leeuwenhoekiella palythoae]